MVSSVERISEFARASNEYSSKSIASTTPVREPDVVVRSTRINPPVTFLKTPPRKVVAHTTVDTRNTLFGLIFEINLGKN